MKRANQEFLTKLQHQAALQAKLNKRRFLPTQFDFLTSLIGRYAWQFLVITSGITALLIEVFTNL